MRVVERRHEVAPQEVLLLPHVEQQVRPLALPVTIPLVLRIVGIVVEGLAPIQLSDSADLRGFLPFLPRLV